MREEQNTEPIALTAMRHHANGEYAELRRLLGERQAPTPALASADSSGKSGGIMMDHSIIADTGGGLVFAWSHEGRWQFHHRQKTPGTPQIPAADRWHEPVYRWPTAATMVNRALLRLEARLAAESPQQDPLSRRDEEAESALITVHEAELLMPGLRHAAEEAAKSNTGDEQLTALDTAESWGADDLELFFQNDPKRTALLSALIRRRAAEIPGALEDAVA